MNGLRPLEADHDAEKLPGASLEPRYCVVAAVTKARLTGTPITGQDLVQAAVKIVPLSRTMHEQINHIRGWAFERALRASRRGTGR